MQGYVEDLDDDGSSTTVYFEAYAGTTKIASTTRTASTHNRVSYSFPIGDPDLVGGFDRLKIQICLRSTFACSNPVDAHRDYYAEQLS
ncbi:hypothetical protein ACFU6I_26855 [Streptomyces sp. NPDC057486]|uniref:hypothetical protein n=1 Tax=Streptomyces sp. NPDC057486 TaxID=3346145 RepID=UPI0036B747D5